MLPEFFLINRPYFLVCSQMNTLSTQDSNNDKIVAFMSVLACPHVEAAFFLESADWSVEAAVTLWLESGIGTALGDGHKRSRSILPQDDSGHSYSHKQIFIQGLPEDWSAWVSAVSGHIYFTHNESGHRQSNVPPGFADCMHSRDDGVCKISDMMTQDEGESDEGMRNRDRYSNSTAHGSRDEDSEGANDDFSVTETFDNNAFSGIVEMAGGGPSPVTDDKGLEPSDSSQSAIFTDTNDIDNGNTSSSSDISGGGSNDSRRMF
jgi:UBA-like domain